MKSTLVVDRDGSFRVYLKREVAEQIPYVKAAGDGWYRGYWLDIHDLRQHATIVPSPGSVEILKELRDHRAEAIALKDYDGGNYDVLFSDQKRPRGFQTKAINFVLARKSVLIGDDVGLGKTIEAIGVMLEAFDRGEIEKAIVVCSGSLKYQWKLEIQDANAHFPDIDEQIAVVDGTKAQRRKIYELGRPITIMYYSCLRLDGNEIKKMIGDSPILVIADEITAKGACKNRTSKTSQALKAVFRKALYRIAMTATPIENCLEDLFSIFEWIDLRRFGPIDHFTEKHCREINIPMDMVGRKRCRILSEDEDAGTCMVQFMNGQSTVVRRKSIWTFNRKKIVGYNSLKEAESRIADRYIRRTAEEVDVEMPEVVTMVRRINLVPEARKIYQNIVEMIRAEKQAGTGGGMFKAMMPLRRCCAAPCLVGGEGEDSGKIAELVELLDGEFAGQSVIVVTQWREKLMDILRKKLKKWEPITMHGGTDAVHREAARRRFQSGECKLLIMTEVGERGLNLQKGSVIVNFDLPFNPAILHQRIGRIYRWTSEHKVVRVVAFVARDTIEERVLDILSEKGDLFAEVFSDEGLARLTHRIGSISDSKWRKML